MTKPISKLFEEAQRSNVEWEGQRLYGLYEITTPEKIAIEILRSKAHPVQGIKLKATGCALRINDIEETEMTIWADTAPAKFEVTFRLWEYREPKIKLWNVWRGKIGGADIAQAWIGNAGMRIEPGDDGKVLLLRCSDGEGAVDFSDIEARLSISRRENRG